MYIALFALAGFSLILIPLAPRLLRLRVRLLEWVGWSWAVRLIEDHFDAWVLFARILLSVIAALLLYFGWVEMNAVPAG